MGANEGLSKKAKIFNEIIKDLQYILAIGIIVVLLPSDLQYKYQYTEGKPWQYDLLTATFDFPIYKTEVEISNQRNDIIKTHKPYYVLDTSLKSKQIAFLELIVQSLFAKDTISPISTHVISELKKSLINLYDTGILTSQDQSALLAKEAKYIVIMQNNLGQTRRVEDIITEKEAIRLFLKDASRILPESTLNKLPINELIIGNLVYDAETTKKIKNDELNNLSLTSGQIQAGERIIDRGEIVTYEKQKILDSLKKQFHQEERKSNNNTLLLGEILIVSCLILLFYLYARLFRKKFFISKRFVSVTLLFIIGFTIATSMIVQHANPKWVYIIPYSLLPIVLSTFFDTRTGLFAHVITVLLSSFMVPLPFEFVLLQITTGMVAIYSLKDLAQRSQLVQSAIIIVISYCLIYFGYGITIDGDITRINWTMFIYFFVNGVLLLFAYPLIYILEKMFGYISNVTLIELANTNNKVLRNLSELAPGTFQHSMQVSNLASEIAIKVGANPLLARTGAMYHDIGKMKNPAFFTENQNKGNNPHQQLSFEDSARIIIQHVEDGVQIAKDANIPNCIIEFIQTHHGTNKVRFFYNSYRLQFPEKEIDDSIFTYPGPNPSTKETAIVMLCDAVEAASRSLPEYTDEAIDGLVEKIITSLLQEGSLNEAPLTMQHISLTKLILKEKLKNIYHTRISYPELQKNKLKPNETT
ncbi:MAG: HDIG domain-containing protein [Paludibacteraceae bacterium]|jgi:putative nucleotidyltransferase with HDIG domain|nr:HDIG domain-containing protein [Paludibacteraceae bacterium]MBP9647705.1 HDIG domain-containing protein [Paludibacteraceae bacterium]